MGIEEISHELLRILAKYGNISDIHEGKLSEFRYLDVGLIDSISIINFIFEIESEFGIVLSPEDTQQSNFQTISGLAEIVHQKRIRIVD